MGRIRGSRWLRVAEGAVVTGLLVGLFSVVVGPGRVVAELRTADPIVYAVAFGATLAWLLAWSETLLVLLGLRHEGIDPWGFRLVFLAGMGVRGVVPGGSVSGPPVMGYVVSTSTDVDLETGVAMASVAEFLYWLSSMVVVAIGFAAVLLQGTLSERALLLANLLVGVTLLTAVVVVVGIRSPSVIRRLVHRLAGAGRATAGRVSARVRSALAREAVDGRVDRFFRAFRRLAEHPRAVLPGFGAALTGWIAMVVALDLTLLALGADPATFALLFVVPASGIARTFSVLPGGIGGIETTLVVLLVEVAGVGLGTAGTAVLLYRITTYWFRLGVGAVALFYLGLAGTILEGGIDVDTR